MSNTHVGPSIIDPTSHAEYVKSWIDKHGGCIIFGNDGICEIYEECNEPGKCPCSPQQENCCYGLEVDDKLYCKLRINLNDAAEKQYDVLSKKDINEVRTILNKLKEGGKR